MPATPQQLSQVKKWMKDQIELAPETYLECGEVNSTRLGEDATEHFDLYEGPDDETPDWVWEIAAVVEPPRKAGAR